MRASRWAGLGVVAGALAGLLGLAPAAWLARALARASGDRLVLADAYGSMWRGSAVVVLAGGTGTRDAAALPGRLHWRLRPLWDGLELQLTQACCMRQPMTWLLQPAAGGWRARLQRPASTPEGGEWQAGLWPAALLAGLGTPWNTVQPAGNVALRTAGMAFEAAGASVRLRGAFALDLRDTGSRLATLAPLGSYRLDVRDLPDGDGASLQLQTLDGPLRLQGQGLWNGSGLHLQGEARAAPGGEAALANLLNLLGRRRGDTVYFSIG